MTSQGEIIDIQVKAVYVLNHALEIMDVKAGTKIGSILPPKSKGEMCGLINLLKQEWDYGFYGPWSTGYNLGLFNGNDEKYHGHFDVFDGNSLSIDTGKGRYRHFDYRYLEEDHSEFTLFDSDMDIDASEKEPILLCNTYRDKIVINLYDQELIDLYPGILAVSFLDALYYIKNEIRPAMIG